jgi:hypothetical protein
VDRLAAVRELADLFDRPEDGTPEASYSAPEPEREESKVSVSAPASAPVAANGRHRVEDDEEITRGLISRLIDGVKGL